MFLFDRIAASCVKENEEPSDEEIRCFDKNCLGKEVTNEDWVSGTDPEAKIAKMKDGMTHFTQKAEHLVDVDSGIEKTRGLSPGFFQLSRTKGINRTITSIKR